MGTDTVTDDFMMKTVGDSIVFMKKKSTKRQNESLKTTGHLEL